jgi:hypothetical protein
MPAAPRRAVPRATAAPAPWCSARRWTASSKLRAVNACIQFVPSLDGKALFTVEDLDPLGGLGMTGLLHPVQQALVDRHASQCGFCTPGFAMSLFALYENHAGVPHAQRHLRQPVGQPVPVHRLPAHPRCRAPRLRPAAGQRG